MRKVANYTVTDEGRDKGKLFMITEMSAQQGERWAMRALFGLMSANANVPDDLAELGMAGLAEIGLKKLSSLPIELAEVLMNELMGCVEFIPDPHKPQIRHRLLDEVIEEVQTRIKLKWEVLKLHVDFSKAGALSTSTENILKSVRARRPVTKTSQS